MNNEKRQEVERKIVRHLIRTMKAKGWQLVWVHNGEEKILVIGEEQAVEHIFSVDESSVGFRKEFKDKKFGAVTGVTHSVYIVLGNEGHDCIADHSLNSESVIDDDFEDVMGEVQTYCDKQEA